MASLLDGPGFETPWGSEAFLWAVWCWVVGTKLYMTVFFKIISVSTSVSELSLFPSSPLNTPSCPHVVVHAVFKCPRKSSTESGLSILDRRYCGIRKIHIIGKTNMNRYTAKHCCVYSLQVLSFSPTVQRHEFEMNW